MGDLRFAAMSIGACSAFKISTAFLCLIAVPLLLVGLVSAEAETEIEEESAAAEPLEEVSPDPFDAEGFHSGVLFGHILYIDPSGEFIFVLPSDRSIPRKNIYLDRMTRFTEMVEGRRARRRIKDLLEGQRVAVRYIAEERLALAEEIFLVEGEFDPDQYSARR